MAYRLTSGRLTVATILVLTVSAIAAARWFGRPGPARRPSVLLVTIDTLRADALGAYGASGARTPALDRLATDGTLFENAFTSVPVTLPAHATLLTGLLPPHHGVRGNSFYRLGADVPTLATILAAQGYETAAFVGAVVLDRRFGLSRGFASYDDEIPADATALIAERAASDVVDRALSWRRERHGSGSPLFQWVHLFEPHTPYAPPEPWRSMFPSAPYGGEVASVDAEVGRLLAALGAETPHRATVVAVTSDHGESLGEHGEATHGVLLHDATLRVPLIVSGPGVPRGARRPGLTGLVDVMPTLLALAGVPAPATDGRDLFSADASDPEVVYAETFLPRDFYEWSPLKALRSTGLKLIDGPVPELFDLRADPGELRNLAAERPRDVETFRDLLDARFKNRTRADPVGLSIDDEMSARLRSLGYANAGAAAADSRKARPDPKGRLPLVRLLDEALALVAARRLEEATTKLRDVLASDPSNFLARHTLGDLLFDQGAQGAATEYEQILAMGRDGPYYQYRLGVLYEQQGAYRRAADHFAQLLRLSPDTGAALADRAEQLLGSDLPDAAATYARALGIHAREPAVVGRFREVRVRALNRLGAIRAERGQYSAALEALGEAVTAAPDDFESLANLGFAALRSGDERRALTSLERALEQRPAETRVLNVAAELRSRAGDHRAAAVLLERSLAADPAQPVIASALQRVRQRLTDNRTATKGRIR